MWSLWILSGIFLDIGISLDPFHDNHHSQKSAPGFWSGKLAPALWSGAATMGLPAFAGRRQHARPLKQGKPQEARLIKYFSVPCTPTKANGGRTWIFLQMHRIKWETFNAITSGMWKQNGHQSKALQVSGHFRTNCKISLMYLQLYPVFDSWRRTESQNPYGNKGFGFLWFQNSCMFRLLQHFLATRLNPLAWRSVCPTEAWWAVMASRVFAAIIQRHVSYIFNVCHIHVFSRVVMRSSVVMCVPFSSSLPPAAGRPATRCNKIRKCAGCVLAGLWFTGRPSRFVFMMETVFDQVSFPDTASMSFAGSTGFGGDGVVSSYFSSFRDLILVQCVLYSSSLPGFLFWRPAWTSSFGPFDFLVVECNQLSRLFQPASCGPPSGIPSFSWKVMITRCFNTPAAFVFTVRPFLGLSSYSPRSTAWSASIVL